MNEHSSAKDPMLRPAASCDACHGEFGPVARSSGTGRSARVSHAQSLNRAHLAMPTNSNAMAGGGASSLDQETRSCVSCHDGTIAGDAAGVRTPAIGGHEADHPVGVLYRDRALAGGKPLDMPLSPAFRLGDKVRLFDNRVGCGSCHSLYSSEKHLLVMSNYGSKLCLTCHGGR